MSDSKKNLNVVPEETTEEIKVEAVEGEVEETEKEKNFIQKHPVLTAVCGLGALGVGVTGFLLGKKTSSKKLPQISPDVISDAVEVVSDITE